MENNKGTNKTFKDSQIDFFKKVEATYPVEYKKFVTTYLIERVRETYRKYSLITPSLESSEAKAVASEINGGIIVLEELRKRF